MDSYIDIPFHQQHQSQNPNSGLLRFRSAPSSLLSNFRDSLGKKYDYNQTPRLATAGGDDSFGSIESKSLRVPQNGYSDSGSRTIGMQCQLPFQYLKESVVITSEAIGGSYKVDGSAMDQSTEGKTVVGSNLDRHSSSPAGLLAHLDAKNGHNMMIGSRSFRIGSDTIKESSPPTSRLIGQIDFASGLSSSMSILQRIPPNENKNDKCNCAKFINGEGDDQFYSPGLAFTSWNDTASLVDSTPEDRADQRNNRVLYSCLDESIAQACNQNDGLQTRTSWSHQVSLPNTSAVMAAMEKLLHFQDAVPCKIRAKRGSATHPRSIAERVRRTRISERMKKLQELVPNIEKQMNTTDMLDLAIEYIKDLQKQHKALSDNRAKCKCSNVQNQL